MSTAVIVTSLNVPALTDNTIAFANAASWNQYWLGAGFSANVPVSDTVTYGVVMAATTVSFVAPVLSQTLYLTQQFDMGDGLGLQPYTLILASSFDALVVAFNALLTDYVALKTALKTSGQISDA